MSVLKTSIAGLKPVIYVAWIVAIARLLVEAVTTDVNVVAMISVYGAIGAIFLFAGFTGALDKLVWKPLLLGSLVLAFACYFLPNTIAYGTAQFQGWTHGRFYNDPEHEAIRQREMKAGAGFFEANKTSVKELGRADLTHGPAIADTPGGKVKAALLVATLTMIPGGLWCVICGVLFVGIPASVRRRRERG